MINVHYMILKNGNDHFRGEVAAAPTDNATHVARQAWQQFLVGSCIHSHDLDDASWKVKMPSWRGSMYIFNVRTETSFKLDKLEELKR